MRLINFKLLLAVKKGFIFLEPTSIKKEPLTPSLFHQPVREDEAEEMELQLCIHNTQSPCFPSRRCRKAIVHSQHILCNSELMFSLFLTRCSIQLILLTLGDALCIRACLLRAADVTQFHRFLVLSVENRNFKESESEILEQGNGFK